MNLLLVPFPYAASRDSFSGSPSAKDDWGRFGIRQTWLTPERKSESTAKSRKDFKEFVDALIHEVDGPVHGVVLPEYSLDWQTYDELARHLSEFRPQIEILLGGVSSDCNGRKGNQIAVSSFFADTVNEVRLVETHSRRKHHRWFLDGSQIENYGLGKQLPTTHVYWEHMEVEERVVHVDVFRASSTLTAVLCEDLARMDPALGLLRTIGPNLVIGLAMDGPQMKGRWPGVYATGLADDPGCSVLTLTSKAMISWTREARQAKHKDSAGDFVALWKNYASSAPSPAKNAVEINLEPGKHAILLGLKGNAAQETTIDGRKNSDAIAWTYVSADQVGLSEESARHWGWILGTD